MQKRKEIINPFQINSKEDFGTFYTTYFRRFVRYAFYYVNNQETAEDITHDSLLYYWENREKLAKDTDVLGYILLTVRNKCLNFLKHLRVEAEYNKNYLDLYEWEVNARIMTLENENYSELFTKEMRKIIKVSLSKLPTQTQYIFIQNRFYGKSRKEIAAELKVSIQKIDYHINKANSQLYKDLKDYLPVLLLFLDFF